MSKYMNTRGSLFALRTFTDIYKHGVRTVLYTELPFVKDSYPGWAICRVLGDFSVVFGCNQAGYELFLGLSGLRADTSSGNCHFLLDLVRSQQLKIAGTCISALTCIVGPGITTSSFAPIWGSSRIYTT